ncbi:MAG: hypothetical protein ABA06_01055 [Parcubacteria bacterium C7867-001]|nr:MAG: hypothetical protein ABA06_01055 [Parcubacteria bacterium C7867-001]
MNIILRLWRKMRDLEYRFLIVATIAHFVLWYLVFWATEAPDAAMLKPVNYWYFWSTTALTIGYGDLSPQSELSRLIAPVFQFTGLIILTTWLTKVGSAAVEHMTKKRRGLMPTKLSGHILVLGDYHPVRTDDLLSNAILDRQDDGSHPHVVGCFRNTGDRNPFVRPQDYHGITPEYVQAAASGFNMRILEEAGAERASHIYVNCEDDNTAIGLVCLLSRMQIKARVGLILQEYASAELVPACPLELQIIKPIQAVLAVRAMEDPGTEAAIRMLLTTGGTKSMHSLEITGMQVSAEHVSFGSVRAAFENLFKDGALLLGFTRVESGAPVPYLMPNSAELVRQNDRLLYIADKDFSAMEEQSFNSVFSRVAA